MSMRVSLGRPGQTDAAHEVNLDELGIEPVSVAFITLSDGSTFKFREFVKGELEITSTDFGSLVLQPSHSNRITIRSEG